MLTLNGSQYNSGESMYLLTGKTITRTSGSEIPMMTIVDMQYRAAMIVNSVIVAMTSSNITISKVKNKSSFEHVQFHTSRESVNDTS